MRRMLPIAVLLMCTPWVAVGVPCFAQPPASGDAAQQMPDAPQPQKKKTDKKKAAHKDALRKAAAGSTPASGNPAAPNQSANQTGSQTAVPPQPPADGASADKNPASGNANPFPEDISRRAAQADASSAAVPSAPSPATGKSNANPFPEAVSRRAAQAAGNAAPADAKTEPALPPGESSSNSLKLENLGNSPAPKGATVTDPVRAKKDTQVGDFYLSRGDANGAYMRFKDALAYDPTNMDAVYGLAESAMRLKKFSEAEHNYQLYLQVVPTGGKAKQAAKGLVSLAKQK